uniref:Uncharacterized protein n=1 Tax=Ciona savignyi TaxID=51511 RepID=H2YRR5_CIOSA
MAEVLYESLNGDTEIACRLRAELDLADQLDNKLINQLTGAVDGADEDQSSTTSSPSKETEISSKLQHLLSRLHN